MSDFVISQYDLLPLIDATVEDANGVVDLSTATGALFIWKSVYGSGDAPNTGNATILSPISGALRFSPTSTLTDVSNVYYGQFRVQFSGKDLSFPNDSPSKFEIVRRVGF